MALPGMYQPQLMKTWNVGNEQVQEKFLVGREHMSSFSLDPVYMGDGNAYVFSLKLVDDQYHQFFVEKTQRIVTRQCLRVADVFNNEPERTFTTVTGPNNVPDDLCFNFEIKRIDGCVDSFDNELIEEITISTQPAIDAEILSQIIPNMNMNNI